MKRILVVDDDPACCSVMKISLQRAGHEVVTAKNGVEGMHLLCREAFDLALIDLLMPEKDAVEMLMEMRKVGLQLPVLIMSGANPSMRYALRPVVLQLGAISVLNKPFSQEELNAHLSAVLSRDTDLKSSNL